MMPDDIAKQIDDLIIETPDAKDKALLLILKKISNNLEDNTDLTRTLTSDLRAHTQAFEQHEKDELALINQGRGFLRAAVVGLAVVQAFSTYFFQKHLESEEDIARKAAAAEIYIAQHKTHHEMEERQKALK